MSVKDILKKQAEEGKGVDVEMEESVVDKTKKETTFSFVKSIEVEAVVGGVHQRITLEGVNPAEVKAYLLSFDANAMVRDAFPSKGFGGGQKEIKTGLLNSLTVKGGKYPGIDMVVVGEDGSGTAVGVPQKKRELFPQEFEKIAPPEKVGDVRELVAGKEGAMTFLSGQLGNGRQINVKYSVYEGKGFFEGFETERVLPE